MTFRIDQLNRAEFLEKFGRVFEHSPWIAETVWAQGLSAEANSPGELHRAFSRVIRKSSKEQQLALLKAHPKLAVAVDEQKGLTAESQSEQKGAGLDRCSPEEFVEFRKLNSRYEKKFGFPFIMAVAGYNRQQILGEFRARVSNPSEQEFQMAVEQVIRIGGLRIGKITQDMGKT